MARAVSYVCTQRQSVDVITGTIKHFQPEYHFRLHQIDIRTILGEQV